MSGGNWKEMFSAATAGDLELVDYHVSRGVDMDYVHPEILGTALVASILAGHEAVALYLIESGANPNLVSEFEGLSPVAAARRAGAAKVEAALIKAGARPVAAEPPASGDSGPSAGGWLSRLRGVFR
ncbi:MAG: ankyrin repeat domain-containing protein [Acidobacteriota bacterium]